jgi:hypothetical protein
LFIFLKHYCDYSLQCIVSSVVVCDSVYNLGNSSILYNLARFIEYAAILKKVLGCEFFCLNWCWKILFFFQDPICYVTVADSVMTIHYVNQVNCDVQC